MEKHKASYLRHINNFYGSLNKNKDFYEERNKLWKMLNQMVGADFSYMAMLTEEYQDYYNIINYYDQSNLLQFEFKSYDTMKKMETHYLMHKDSFEPFLCHMTNQEIFRFTENLTKPSECSAENSFLNIIYAHFKTGYLFPIRLNGKIVGHFSLFFRTRTFLDRERLEFIKLVAYTFSILLENTEKNKTLLINHMQKNENALTFDMQRSLMSDNDVRFDFGGRLDYIYSYGTQTNYLPQLSTRLGGDYCQLFWLNPKEGVVFIADVMGHGMKSNYFVPMMKGILKSMIFSRIVEPAQIMKGMNRLLMKELEHSNMFITAHALKIDFENKQILSTNAGHTKPIAFYHHGMSFDYHILSDEGGLPLGIDKDAQYRETVHDVRSDDYVVLYTDGVLEATDASDEMFGDQALLDFLKRNHFDSGNSLCKALHDEVMQYSMYSKKLQDDIMIVAVTL